MYSRLRQQLSILTVLTGLFMAVLACTSNDTLFIQLTATPTPTITPTALALETKLNAGDVAWTISSGYTMGMLTKPGTGVDLGAGGQCFRNTKVTVVSKSKDVDNPSSNLILYQVDCGSGLGWLKEYELSKIDPAGIEALIKSPDGKGAILYSEADAKSKPVSTTPCADGTKVTTSDVAENPNVADASQDPHLYVQITCGSDTGYVLETMLVPASS
jgi:hypothetical protein